MKIYALICLKLDLTQFWPKVVSWTFEINTDELSQSGCHQKKRKRCNIEHPCVLFLQKIMNCVTTKHLSRPIWEREVHWNKMRSGKKCKNWDNGSSF